METQPGERARAFGFYFLWVKGSSASSEAGRLEQFNPQAISVERGAGLVAGGFLSNRVWPGSAVRRPQWEKLWEERQERAFPGSPLLRGGGSCQHPGSLGSRRRGEASGENAQGGGLWAVSSFVYTWTLRLGGAVVRRLGQTFPLNLGL